MQVLILIGVALIAAVLTFTINWLALIPWRRSKDQHWTERARLCYPVRTAAASNLWVLPAILTMTVLLLWPDESPHWMLLVLFTGIGTVVGTIPMDHEMFPRIPLNELLRLIAASWLIRFTIWLVFLTAIALSPDKFNSWSFIIGAVVVVLLVFWSKNGWIWAGRKLGLFLTPPERLQNIVRDTAIQMNVLTRELWLIRGPAAVAYAMPTNRTLLFSEPLLQTLSDDEIAAVCAHELAHLTEAKTEYYKRYVQWLMFLPWLFFKPIVRLMGLFGYVILVCATTIVPRVYRDISRKLEARADEMAKAEERDPGTYAQALARIYEVNLMPATTDKPGTHPDLYDRLLAAGVTPDFPRPVVAKSATWYGHVLGGLLALLAMAMIIRYTN